MQKGIKKLPAVLGIILVIFFILFLCKDPIVDAIFYDMDSTMDLPKDIKDYKPKSKKSSSEKAKTGQYETEEEIGTGEEDSEQIYIVDVQNELSLRNSPGSGELITKLPADTEVFIIDDSTAPFVEVKLVDDPELRGYVNQEFLTKKTTNSNE